MKEWKLEEAQQCLGEVLRRAGSCGPQRVRGPHADVVVLSAAEFDRLVGCTELLEEDEFAGEPSMSFVEFMRTSPLAEAMAAGEFSPEEWDRACRIGR
jgi:hypothetical protein